jgi:hypothetical protein
MAAGGRKSTRGPGLEAARKVAHAMELRDRDYTWQEAADEAGYGSGAACYNAVKRARDRMIREPAEHLVQVELEKLRMMEKVMLPKATKRGKSQLGYSAGVLRIMERRSKLLGLDDFERRSIELAERSQALEASQSAIVADFMRRVFARMDLTPEQLALVDVVVPEELAKITLEHEPDELEALDEPEEEA